MKQNILVGAMALAMLSLVGCSSTKTTNSGGSGMINPGAAATTPIAEQRLAVSEFKKDGIKVYYSLFGNLEAIEVTGYAAVWGNSMNAARESYRIAELEAKKTLNDFINKESISSTVSVRMISKNLEDARDNNTNRFSSNKSLEPDQLVAIDEEVTKRSTDTNTNTTENQAVRNNAVRIASTLQTTITNSNRGILGGLYLKESAVIDGGRAVRVVMRWDLKHNETRKQLRNLMAQ